jgi:S1-C subfamily serine protease
LLRSGVQYGEFHARRTRGGLAQATGAVVSAVDAESPADHAGLLTGDILLAVDGVPVTGADDLVRLLDA